MLVYYLNVKMTGQAKQALWSRKYNMLYSRSDEFVSAWGVPFTLATHFLFFFFYFKFNGMTNFLTKF